MIGDKEFVGGNIMQSASDVMVRVKAIYEQRFRSLLETEENLGKFLTVDIHSGDY